MSGQWSKERAWEWYNSRPWIRGYNFMPSDCANRIDMWQEYKFEEHFETAERYYEFVREIITTYAHDERVLIRNLFNEPGNNRADLSLSHMEKFFEIARKIKLIKSYNQKADERFAKGLDSKLFGVK